MQNVICKRGVGKCVWFSTRSHWRRIGMQGVKVVQLKNIQIISGYKTHVSARWKGAHILLCA